MSELLILVFLLLLDRDFHVHSLFLVSVSISLVRSSLVLAPCNQFVADFERCSYSRYQVCFCDDCLEMGVLHFGCYCQVWALKTHSILPV